MTARARGRTERVRHVGGLPGLEPPNGKLLRKLREGVVIKQAPPSGRRRGDRVDRGGLTNGVK